MVFYCRGCGYDQEMAGDCPECGHRLYASDPFVAEPLVVPAALPLAPPSNEPFTPEPILCACTALAWHAKKAKKKKVKLAREYGKGKRRKRKFTMWFGKYEGKRPKKLPRGYANWVWHMLLPTKNCSRGRWKVLKDILRNHRGILDKWIPAQVARDKLTERAANEHMRAIAKEQR